VIKNKGKIITGGCKGVISDIGRKPRLCSASEAKSRKYSDGVITSGFKDDEDD
jgi:hypothetical protein